MKYSKNMLDKQNEGENINNIDKIINNLNIYCEIIIMVSKYYIY